MTARRATLLGLAALAAAAAYLAWRHAQPSPAAGAAPMGSHGTANPRDPELVRAAQLINALDAAMEDYTLAEDLVRQVLAQNPDDPQAVLVYAEVSNELILRGFDVSDKRRMLAKSYSERAVALAPGDAEALSTLGINCSIDRAELPRAAELLRRSIALDPNQPRAYRALFGVLLLLEPEKALPLAEQAAARFPRDALIQYDLSRLYRDSGRFADMDKALDDTLALASITSAIVGKARLALALHGDVGGMRSWLERVPIRQQLNDRSVLSRYLMAYVSGRPEEGLQSLQPLLEDWMEDFDYTGPKAMLVGDLLLLEGRDADAAASYQAAMELLGHEKALHPASPRMRVASMWTLYRLGRLDESRAACREIVAGLRRPYRVSLNWWFSPVPASLLLGERAQALQLIREASGGREARDLIRTALGYDPRMAPFRGDAEIQALVAAAPR